MIDTDSNLTINHNWNFFLFTTKYFCERNTDCTTFQLI